MSRWQVTLEILAGLAGVYAILLVALWVYARRYPGTVGMRDALQLLPDLLRLLQGLITEGSAAWSAGKTGAATRLPAHPRGSCAGFPSGDRVCR
ncbi:hypothetical protein OIU93_18250 [Paeniglutamicibacter sp. ZC-3]|uniref:hypothetical protein n=1 Tax=Paeniglutamicibacter sp. ZC-3 TaxID=2986919 RepID=UPI0021F744A8|nr:hypothetical protein [Paeniglutamicibacter sp. ZC-3]MCV9996218.1 hypothetical protein [Paeniglutamicibacter sp. ZC-3]